MSYTVPRAEILELGMELRSSVRSDVCRPAKVVEPFSRVAVTALLLGFCSCFVQPNPE